MPEHPPEAAASDDPNILSFIVRVWKEETGPDNPGEVWRGHITPVATGERHYFTNIDQIPALIEAHLNQDR